MSETLSPRERFFARVERLMVGFAGSSSSNGTSAFPHAVLGSMKLMLAEKGYHQALRYHQVVSTWERVEMQKKAHEICKQHGLVQFRRGIDAYHYDFDESLGCPRVMLSVDKEFIDIEGIEEDVYKWEEIFKEHMPDTHLKISVATSLYEGTKINLEAQLIATTTDQALPCFYPFLPKGLDDLSERFLASKASVLILFGPPGTGKTTFLRSMIAKNKLKTLVAFREDVIESPALLDTYRSGKYKLLALEDADNLIQSREKGNRLMSSLLNVTDGIANVERVKLVISTNLPTIDKIDSALLRPGRCFSTIKFRELTSSEAEAIQKETGVDAQDYSAKESWTLSEVLNPVLEIDDQYLNKPRSMGFLS